LPDRSSPQRLRSGDETGKLVLRRLLFSDSRTYAISALPATDARRVVAYIRTSSAEQGKAYGPEVQRRAVRAFAATDGLEVVAIVHEDVSGTVRADDRPGLQGAIAAAFQYGAAAIVVAERSRLARDEFVAHDALRSLRAVGLDVLYADGGNGTDDSALLMDGIGHVIAAHDRRRIVARLKAGRDAKAAAQPASRPQGGRLPYGYRRGPGGTVEIDPQPAAEIRRAFDLVRGGKSIAKAAAVLTQETGRTWSPKVLDRMLRREEYKSRTFGQIIDGRVWTATHAALASRRKTAA
jgi:DNA invertase Pin-like site-specific DNA recombinase